MTPPPKAPNHDANVDYLRREIGRLSNQFIDLAGRLVTIKRENESLREEFEKIASRLQSMERSNDGTPEGSPQAPTVKPIPANPSSPTDDEIERHILYELYNKTCWNGKHTSQEHLRRGYMAKVEHRQVWAALNRLRNEGIVLPHGKSAEEQYSLNPEKAATIYRRLGIPSRCELAPTTSNQHERERQDMGTSSVARQAAEFVDLGQYKNTVRGVKESISSLSQGITALSSEVADSKRFVTDLEEKLKGRQAALEGRLQRIEESFDRTSTSTPLSFGDGKDAPRLVSEGGQ